jgi:hypothetical protein
MILYEQFYRRGGIRKVGQLMSPPLLALPLLSLPKSSVLHYVGSVSTDVGPASDDYIFRAISKPILMHHVMDNGDNRGAPRKLAIQPNALTRAYFNKNKRFRKMHSLEASTRDPSSLVVYNYGFIPQGYRYQRSIYAEYYRWWNIQASVWKQVTEIADVSPRQQYLRCTLPAVLPSLGALRVGDQPMSQRMMRLFRTPESMMILELYKWFGEKREESVLHHLPEKYYDRVNIIYVESGRWFVMNLGVLNRWRAATAEELEKNPEANTLGFTGSQIQRRFLRMLMSLSEVRTVAAAELDKDDSGEVGTIDNPNEITTDVQKNVLPVMNQKTGSIELKTILTKVDSGLTDQDHHAAGPEDDVKDIKIDPNQEKAIADDLAVLDKILADAHGDLDNLEAEEGTKLTEVVDVPIKADKKLEDGIVKICARLAEVGGLSAAEYLRYERLAKSYETIVAPDGKTPMAEFIKVPSDLLKIHASPEMKDISAVIDKTMMKSSLIDFDERYVKHVMARDIASMVMSVQNAGIAVTNYNVEKVDDVLGGFDSHTVRITPVDGAAGTLHFKLPSMNDDGSYMANGIRYRLRKQRGDLPIRKVAPDRVSLTSYYGKASVSRTAKRVANRGLWLRNAVMAKAEDPADTTVLHANTGNVFDNYFVCPRLYSTMAMGFRGITVAGFEMSFDHTKRVALYGQPALDMYELDGSLVCGINKKGEFMVMDINGVLYRGVDSKMEDLGTLESLIHLELEKAPVDFVELRALGQPIPIGLVLGYEMGLTKLMKLLKVAPLRRVAAGSRVGLEPHEYGLAFSDETLVFSRDDQVASLILAGFGDFHKHIRQYAAHQFDSRDVYLNVLEGNHIGVRYVREIDLMYQMFVDSITRDLLIEMNEPTDFQGLLLRSCEMLLTDQHPHELDPAFMRIKGNERMAGAVYSEIVRSIRAHNGRPGKSKVPLDMGPYTVWKNITTDPANALLSEINPIQNLKEIEMVTTGGTGGRGSRSMTKHTRSYHINDMGTMSESTVDSSDVGINVQLSADPQFTSLRGISRRYKIGETGATALLSTSALLAPGSDRDDPKRVNFIAIQQSHGIACNGYTQAAVRTGYEQVLAHRTGDLFSMSARKPGKVTSVTEEGIVVTYDDGEVKGFELGRRYGSAAGLTIPHTVISEMKVGQKFDKGQILCYNTGFFERDLLNPNNIVWKAGVTVRLALLESTQTLEDASSISPRVAKLLTTPMTKVKTYTVNFDQSVRRLVKAGDKVESEDILCVIEDAVTSGSDLFDESTLDTLRILSAQAPQAKTKGIVERVEVFYHGDKEDMSETLRAIANASDRDLVKRGKAIGKAGYTGSVDEGFRVEGTPLSLDTMAIRVYITADVDAGVGDKGVFYNQMKTVFSEILPGDVVTESGLTIDGIFGQKSIADRIVTSPEVIGTTTVLLGVLGRKAAEAYFGTK